MDHQSKSKERCVSNKDAIKNNEAKTTASTSTAGSRDKRYHCPRQSVPSIKSLPTSGHIKKVLKVKNEKLGRIIGGKGQTMKAIKAECMVECAVVDETSVHVWGPSQGVEIAVDRIRQFAFELDEQHCKRQERVEAMREYEEARNKRNEARQPPTTLPEGHCLKTLELSAEEAGCIYGKGHRLVQSARDKHGVGAAVENSTIIVWGEAGAVANAISELRERQTKLKKKVCRIARNTNMKIEHRGKS